MKSYKLMLRRWVENISWTRCACYHSISTSSDHVITRTQSLVPPAKITSDRADEPIVAVLISLGLTGQTTNFYPQTPTSLVNQTFPNILTVNLQNNLVQNTK